MNAEVFIPLTRGLTTVIDFDDFEKVRGFSWHAHTHRNSFCAARTEYVSTTYKKTIRMHRELLGATPKQEVDHKDGDALDNRKTNLRLCTQAQNGCNTRLRINNTSGFKGVRWHNTGKNWQAYVQRNRPKQFFHLGLFSSAIAAAKAYDQKARELFGDFANLNFKESGGV